MRVVQVVHLVVPRRHLARQRLVLVHQRPEHLPRQRRGEAAHLGQLAVRLDVADGRQLARLLGHGRGVVAHPLQVVGHVVERQQEAQVAGNRLLGRDGARDERA